MNSRTRHAVVRAGALASVAFTANSALNLRVARHPAAQPAQIHERVSILIPARNEAHRITPTLRSVLAQEGLSDAQIIILDDGSTDGTGEVIRRAIGTDPRVKVLDGDDNPPPKGWLGKPWACHRLSQEATGNVLIFIDADVVLHPHAIASAVQMLRRDRLHLLSPYPRQIAQSIPERITQPLVTWSWLSTLPLLIAERSRIPQLSAAIGQFLVVDAAAYRASGGHTAVAGEVIEDAGVIRALKRHGYRGMPAIGGDIATCRMYDGAAEVYEGYTKSLWSVFGTTPGAIGGMALMGFVYVVPPVLGLTAKQRSTKVWGAVGYGAGVAGRVMISRAARERTWPDALAQPLSAGTFAALTGLSVLRK
ncbi:MAG: glycosyltransferase, partial [Actinomycetales bacterium]